ncbi:MAG TPA: hypothetical protein VFK56_06725 [Mycobacterium sp.]|nr:hypothetical protein [Mycobacterium sp.]
MRETNCASGRLTSLITEGRIRDGSAMAAELRNLIHRIDSPPALRAEIPMAIAFAQYMGCAFDQGLRTTEQLRVIPEANLDDVVPAASVAGVIRVVTGHRVEGLQDFETALDLGREIDPVTYANRSEQQDANFRCPR